jgi:hypothetical protein
MTAEYRVEHVDPDDDTLILTADRLQCVYQRTDDGDDLLGVLIDDPVAGSVFLALAPEQAQDIATNLGGMVANLDDVRAKWDQERPA